MLKGVQENMRDQNWHERHMAKMKRRENIRQLHIDRNRAFMSARYEQQKELESKSSEVDRKKDWNKLQYFLMGIFFFLTNPFRNLIKAIKYKYGNVQA